MGRKFQKILVMGALVFGLWANSIFGLAAELTVTAETAKIRAEASTSSEVVGSTQKGKKLTSEGEATDSSGAVWYKVAVNGNNYGYIRSDLVEKSGSSSSTTNSQPSQQQPSATVPTAIAEQQATIAQRSVNIRSGASTSHSTVASLPADTVITLIGEAKDSSGKQWYQMKCTYNNKEVIGYVRYDLITIGAAVEPTEGNAQTEDPIADETGENAEIGEGTSEEMPLQEEAEESSPLNMDYEIVYEKNDIGENEYYLYDYVQGNKQKVADLFNVVNTAQANQELYQKQINNEKIIIIILAVVIVVLVLVVTLLIFKIRDLYSDYEEDDEEEEYEPIRKTALSGNANRSQDRSGSTQRSGGRNPQEQSYKQSQSRPSQPNRAQRPSQQMQEEQRNRRPRDPELRAAERTERPTGKPEGRPAPTRKPQNFLHDDDEFEFEFLNMDDKDLKN